jgi:hypothetical protein
LEKYARKKIDKEVDKRVDTGVDDGGDPGTRISGRDLDYRDLGLKLLQRKRYLSGATLNTPFY